MTLLHFQQCLYTNSGENWIARQGPIKCPPRSSDLSILDFHYGVASSNWFTLNHFLMMQQYYSNEVPFRGVPTRGCKGCSAHGRRPLGAAKAARFYYMRKLIFILKSKFNCCYYFRFHPRYVTKINLQLQYNLFY